MILRLMEPRAAVSLTIMSLALLALLRRSGAFRSSPLLLPRRACEDGNLHTTTARSSRYSSSSAAGEAAVQARVAGPEGTELPSVMHKVVGVDELKVRTGFARHLYMQYGSRCESSRLFVRLQAYRSAAVPGTWYQVPVGQGSDTRYCCMV